MRTYFIYILASHSRRLYTGVTSDLVRRTFEHKNGISAGFAERYRISKLVYFETTTDVRVAIAREKQIKRLTRARKYNLIEPNNPEWRDLSEGWFR